MLFFFIVIKENLKLSLFFFSVYLFKSSTIRYMKGACSSLFSILFVFTYFSSHVLLMLIPFPVYSYWFLLFISLDIFKFLYYFLLFFLHSLYCSFISFFFLFLLSDNSLLFSLFMHISHSFISTIISFTFRFCFTSFISSSFNYFFQNVFIFYLLLLSSFSLSFHLTNILSFLCFFPL